MHHPYCVPFTVGKNGLFRYAVIPQHLKQFGPDIRCHLYAHFVPQSEQHPIPPGHATLFSILHGFFRLRPAQFLHGLFKRPLENIIFCGQAKLFLGLFPSSHDKERPLVGSHAHEHGVQLRIEKPLEFRSRHHPRRVALFVGKFYPLRYSVSREHRHQERFRFGVHGDTIVVLEPDVDFVPAGEISLFHFPLRCFSGRFRLSLGQKLNGLLE